MDIEVIRSALPLLLQAGLCTLAYAASSTVIGFCIAVPICMARLSDRRVVAALGAAYVSIFRGVPLLVQLLIDYYCLPLVGINVSSSAAAVTGLSMCTAAYIAEILRGGFLGIPAGQIEAARIIGFSRWQILRTIEVPLAVRLTVPALTNEMIMLVRTTSLVSVVGVWELTRAAQNMAASSFRPVEAYLAAGALYFLINGALSLLGRRVERHFERQGR